MTQVSSSVFKTNTSTLYADNATGDISAADIRAQMDDMADSASFINAGNSSAPGANDDGVNTGGNGAAKIGDIWINETSDVGYICLDNSTGAAIWAPMGQLNNVVEDTTPQLGGNLDAQSNNITAVGKIEYADGSNSAPSVTNSGDTDTGMYWSADDTLSFTTGGVEHLRLDSSNLKLTSSNQDIEFNASSSSHVNRLKWNYSGGLQSWIEREHSTGAFVIGNQGSERMRIDSSGRVGIGTNSPAYTVEIENSTGNAQLGLTSSNTGYSELYFGDQTVTNAGALSYDHSNDVLRINVNETERMRVDGSGNVGIGTSNPLASLHVANSTTDYTGDVMISTTRPYLVFDDTTSGQNGFSIGVDGSVLTIGTGDFSANSNVYGTERMRITSAGDVLVGTNTTGIASSTSNTGIQIAPTTISVARSGGATMFLNLVSGDGNIQEWRKAGTTVGVAGNIGTVGLFIGNGDTGLAYRPDSDALYPYNPSGLTGRDNAVDLGVSGARFDDVYATNGTIQTSDERLKTDIQEISEAEAKVALAAKGLLRKYRWKESVAEKGDNARYHFGIIAQDLKSAFEAEGLDAGDYAMFIHDYWYVDADGQIHKEQNEDGSYEEHERMGVRYPELLAFIIAAI